MKRFDSMTLMGLIVGLGLVLLGIRLEGELGAFWNLSGLLITVGGSFGAVMVNFRSSEIKTVLQVTKQAFIRRDESVVELSKKLVHLARKPAEGLLVLDDELRR